MAWIESHQSLGSHIKLRRLARELHICRPQAVGHLQYLWWWALDNAPSGDLSALAPAEIAEAAEWTGSEEKFLAALTACGWLDADGHLHKWGDYAGRIVAEREQSKQRMRKFREQQKELRNCSANVPATPAQRSELPNPTQPNPTKEEAPASPWHVEFGLDLPEALRTQPCLAAVKKWLGYKKERRQGYKRIGLESTMTKWAKEFTPATFPAAVENSIASNWSGVFPARDSQPQSNPARQPSNQPDWRKMTQEELVKVSQG